MKKIFTFIAMAAIAMTAVFTMTSCERDSDAEDRYQAHTLDGTWTGYIDVYYAQRWGWTGSSYRTAICFVRENAYGGWGYEADYDLDYYDEAYSEFRWEVVNGVIRIDYAAPGWNPIRIYEYRLYDDCFEGYMDDYTGKDIQFKLYYDGSYNWGRWRGGRYVAGRRAAADSVEMNHMGGENGTNYYATGKFAERLKELQEQ
ncbi:MAG: hypothetical protein IJ614_07890 [Prevotella sp.]|nr:hypothetical protein [Prevotella sp.]